MNKGKIIDSIMYVLGVIIAILVFVFQKNYSLLFLIAFIAFVIYGVLFLIKRNNIGFLFNGIGIGGLVSLYIYHSKIFDLGDTVTFFFCMSVAVMLILSLIIGFVFRKIVLKTYNLIIDAEVVDLIRNPNSKKDFYKSVYKYNVAGNDYIVEDIEYKHYFVPNIGDIRKINVNPDDATDVYFLPNKLEDIKNFVGSLFFIIASIIIIITLF